MQLEALQDEFEVAAIDLPGYNASDAPTERSGYLTKNVCATVAQVLAGLGRASCVLVGHDWGGLIAFDFAAMYPDKVTKLVVLASVPPVQFARNADLRQLQRSLYMFAFIAPVLPELLTSCADYAMLDDMFLNPKLGGFERREMAAEELELYKNALARPGALNAALNYYR
jgi:epoxide hydrolase 4